jgi:mono/diheme cytochrome c family protein
MRPPLFILIAGCLLIAASSCYYDKAEILYPSAGCDTTAATSYSQRLVPIFQQSCYACHQSASTGGGILMGNYNADRAIALNGKLFGSINHSAGYSPMPKGGNKLSACQVALVRRWVAAGAPNN